MLKPLFSLPRTVWLIGLISLLNDFASEMVYPLVPLYLTAVLMAGPRALGIIEGIAEATASILKLLSGVIVDRTHRANPWVVAGYALAGFARPLIALATSWPQVLALRFADRVGKGLRGTAFGWFNLTVSLLLLPASVIFGALYQQLGALTAFAFSAACARLAAGLLPRWALRQSRAA